MIVSTDDQEIAEVAREHGAEVPFLRPAHLSDDQASTQAVIAHALEWVQKQGVVCKKPFVVYMPRLPLCRPMIYVSRNSS